MLWIVNCEVGISHYMGSDEKAEMNHIVEAESEQEAESKVRDFYKEKDSDYSVSYWVNFNYCNCVIK